MNPLRVSLAVALVLCVRAIQCLAQQKPESVEFHVTVPTNLGVANKEATVKPSGELKHIDGLYGWVDTNPPPTPLPSAGQFHGSRYWPSGSPAAGRVRPIGTLGPPGTAVTTGPNYIKLQGVVTAVDPGKSVSLKMKTGAIAIYELTREASVPPGLVAGQSVRVRALLDRPGKATDLIERLP